MQLAAPHFFNFWINFSTKDIMFFFMSSIEYRGPQRNTKMFGVHGTVIVDAVATVVYI